MKRRRAQEYNQKGIELCNRNDFERAADQYALAYSSAPITDSKMRSFYLSNQAFALCMLQRFDQALVKARTALVLNPDNTAAKDYKARAELELRRARAIDNNKRGDSHLARNELAKAFEYYALALQQAPDTDLQLRSLLTANQARVHQRLGQLSDALRKCDEALRLDARNKQALETRASLDLEMRRRRALELNAKGHEHLDHGEFAQAIECYKQASTSAPAADTKLRATLASNRALCFLHLKLFDEALASCNEALALDPLCAEARANRAWAESALKTRNAAELNERGHQHLDKGEFELALDAYRQAVAQTPLNATRDRADYLGNQAAALFFLERYDEAIAAADASLRADASASNEHARNWRQSALDAKTQRAAEEWNAVGVEFFKNDEYDKAIEAFDKAMAAVAALGDKADAVSLRSTCLSNQAHSLSMMERFDEALDKAEQALALVADNKHALEQKVYAEQSLVKLTQTVFDCPEGFSYSFIHLRC